MPLTLIEKLKGTDRVALTHIARAVVGKEMFELLDWEVRIMSDKGVSNPDGLFVIEGFGMDGANPSAGRQPWSVVVKNIKTPVHEREPNHLQYWKREVSIFQSGLMKRMPGPVRGPRCYQVSETSEGWQIWMENVWDNSPARWTMDHFRLAARALGKWNGRCFIQGFRPGEPWLSREIYRDWLDIARLDSKWRDYRNPLLQKAISADDHARACRLVDQAERYCAALKKLPQVFSHNDYHRRNLMFTGSDGQEEVVAIDWEVVGMGPLGGDLYSLVGVDGMLAEVEPDDLPALEEVVYPEYLAGLYEEGWNGNPKEIRLAYTAWLGLWLGAVCPALIMLWTTPEGAEAIRRINACEPEEAAASWGPIICFALDRADEAWTLMGEFE